MALAIIDEKVEEKARSFLHDGVSLAAQESAIETILVVIPEVERQPRAAHRPDADVAIIDGGCIAPGVDIVMKHEAAGTVHFFCRAAATVHRHFHQIEQWPGRLWKIADFGRPVVHFRSEE